LFVTDTSAVEEIRADEPTTMTSVSTAPEHSETLPATEHAACAGTETASAVKLDPARTSARVAELVVARCKRCASLSGQSRLSIIWTPVDEACGYTPDLSAAKVGTGLDHPATREI